MSITSKGFEQFTVYFLYLYLGCLNPKWAGEQSQSASGCWHFEPQQIRTEQLQEPRCSGVPKAMCVQCVSMALLVFVVLLFCVYSFIVFVAF
jgi:hypothetical protein